MPKKDQVTTEEREAERTDQPVRATEGQSYDGTVAATAGPRDDGAVAMSEEVREIVERGLERNKKALTELAKW